MLASKGERLIHSYLEYGDINFEEEYTFDDLKSSSGRSLRFDFAIFDEFGDLACLIEYNGAQHYIAKGGKFNGRTGLARQQYNDAAKRSYCLKNNIPLITIPYTEEDNLSFEYLMNLFNRYGVSV